MLKRRIIFLMWTKHVIFILSQNGTAANNPSAQPLKAVSQYYMVKYQSLIIQCPQVMIVWCFHNHHSQVKMSIRSDRVCKRPWNFERVPNKQIEGNDKVEFIILFSKYAYKQKWPTFSGSDIHFNKRGLFSGLSKWSKCRVQSQLKIKHRTISNAFRILEVHNVDQFQTRLNSLMISFRSKTLSAVL